MKVKPDQSFPYLKGSQFTYVTMVPRGNETLRRKTLGAVPLAFSDTVRVPGGELEITTYTFLDFVYFSTPAHPKAFNGLRSGLYGDQFMYENIFSCMLNHSFTV